MGKIIISENVSLDGVIQDPAGDEGFRHGGLLRAYCPVRAPGRGWFANDVAYPAGMLASASDALQRGRVRAGVVVCARELGADLVGVGMLQVLEVRQRLLPDLPSLASA